MKSYTNTQTNLEQELIFPESKIHFSTQRREQLKKDIKEQLNKINLESALSIWLFFENLYLFRLPHLDDLDYPNKEDIDNSINIWNTYIQTQKQHCIQYTKWNSNKLPKIDKKEFHTFLLNLTLSWLLDLDESVINKMIELHNTIIQILDHQNQL